MFSGCTEQKTAEKPVEVNVFIAASLNNVMTELADSFMTYHPGVKISLNADSSGTLANQIKEGYACDVFFSAAQDKMDKLEDEGLVKEGSRKNVVNNQLVVLTYKGSGTAVTGLESLDKAESMALAGAAVPAGAYTRNALISLGILPETEDVTTINARAVSEALGGIEISEQDNVSKVLNTVSEGACEVGTTYFSDTYGYEDKVEILETVENALTGDIVYPIALIENPEATEMQATAAEDFLEYVTSEDSKEIFEKYYFDTDLEKRYEYY